MNSTISELHKSLGKIVKPEIFNNLQIVSGSTFFTTFYPCIRNILHQSHEVLINIFPLH